MAFVGWDIDLGIAQAVHRIHLADLGTGLETAGQSSVQRIEVLVGAYRHTEGNKQMVFLGIQDLVRSVGYSPGAFLRSQAGLEPYLYPTSNGSV